MAIYQPAAEPTMYFIGVTTQQSSIMRVFPRWISALGLPPTAIKGIDLPLHASAEAYREAVGFIKNDPLSLGALVTTHKIDLFQACADMFDYVDPYAQRLNEVSGISKNGAQLCAYAKDPISSGLAMEAFVPEGFWAEHGGEALLLGAGGSSLAMSLYLTRTERGANVPRRITIANRSEPRLEAAQRMLTGLHPDVAFRFVHCPLPEDNDALVAQLPPYSLIVNATGLGKDAPGSPTTDAVSYPRRALVWEINYRGNLLFKAQAEAQAARRQLHVEDGWTYFIYGWTQVMEEVLHIRIDANTLARLSDVARSA